jgi:NADPH:quinone reductase-like Zn-dependent oxidoreductase
VKAVVMREFGGPEVLEVKEVERPKPIPTEVLVRVTAAGINPSTGRRASAAAGARRSAIRP